MSEEALKLEIINQLMSIKDKTVLRRVWSSLKEISSEENILEKLNQPIREKFDIEVLKKEQGFKPINKDKLFKKMDALEIKEPIEELLAMI